MADKSLLMTFVNTEGKKVGLRIDNIKENLTEAEISQAMDLILAKNIFNSSGGELKIKDSAQIVEKNVSKFDMRQL
ncbi:DUF2922 domain-containing protein [Desnuesiella massiliensis]|uniref:DUF2922 domain-containing protein n=1 Tax=Desnuesiella massiliensis TaxID=1650662 RepID=UPI0006E33DFA|nr:DUF2922 domain-containing protein [Desnuesiella massiliensis]